MNILTVNDNVDWSQTKMRVMAVAVALFFAYLANYGCQAYVTFVKTDEEKGNKHELRKLLETSQVMYWYGLACIFSIYPPDFFGIHCSVFAYLTLILLALLHVFTFYNKKVAGRSLWAISYVLYHLSIALWFVFTLVIAYVWTNENYTL